MAPSTPEMSQVQGPVVDSFILPVFTGLLGIPCYPQLGGILYCILILGGTQLVRVHDISKFGLFESAFAV